MELTDRVCIEFNGTYSRALKSAYSTPLRPDVTLTVDGIRYAFDAKYRLDRLALDDDDDDSVGYTYKRADLYKMHTYRDAIRDLRAAFVVFPASSSRSSKDRARPIGRCSRSVRFNRSTESGRCPCDRPTMIRRWAFAPCCACS